MVCVHCGANSFTPRTLSPTGTLYSYSVIHGAGGVWPDVYAVGYVDFPEGVRVFGQLRETDHRLLRIGAQVTVEEAVLYRRKDEAPVCCFRFRSAKGSI
jgi:uncharacterized OB-fold protein